MRISADPSIPETQSITPDDVGAPAMRRPPGVSRLAWSQLLHNRAAMAALLVLVVIAAACAAAPLYAHDIAHTNPFRFNASGTTVVNGKTVPVLQQSTSGLGL